jgi:2-iminobutanoate/2-iminopropanoate deaminase
MRASQLLTARSFATTVLAAVTALWILDGVTPGAVDRAEAQQQEQEDIEFIDNGRFLSGAVRVGRTLYLSGQLGLSGERGIEPETRGALDNVRRILEANGATMDDVVKCTVFLADFAEWSAMNAVYVTYFEKHRPARSAVAVNGMAANARVEIECMAVAGARNAE